MCGIVGYVGAQSALDVVIAGLKRLEYRGYDSAGVAVLADGGLAAAKKAGKLVNLEKELVDRPLPAGPTGHRAHPVGHPRRRPPTPTPTRTSTTRAGSPSSTTGSSRTSPRCGAELAERGHDLASETDTEVVAHLLAEAFSACGDLAEAMRQVCRRLEGAFTLVAVHADEPDVVVGARRNSPLVVGVGEGETFLASDVAAFIAHTRSAIELGQDQVVELRRDGRHRHRLRRATRRGARVPRRLGRLRRREGRLRLLHAQGDRRAAQGRRRHPAGPDRRARAR